MRVLVTGGAGYIGSHAARQLRQHGHPVRVYDNLSTGHACLAQGFDCVVGDVADREKLLPVLREVDAVMHFAGSSIVSESVQHPQQYFENNVQSGLALLNAVREAGTLHFIFSSSCAVYGTPLRNPIPETESRKPGSPYGVSKLFMEYALESYAKAYGIRCASLRYFNAAGADEGGETGELHRPETHLIPSALEAAAGMREYLEIYGTDYPTPDGTCVRDYVHVSDLAEAHVLTLEYLAAGRESSAFNLGSERGYSVREVIATVEEVTGRRVPTRVSPRRKGDPPVLVAESQRARELLHWKPTRSLRDMVATAWNWQQSRMEMNEQA
jgi:UDP-glucose-4-epimerase GalE